MTRTRYCINDAAKPHFMTCTIVGWQPVFTRPVHWRYSSARNYAGQRGLIEVVTDWA